jgi:hypothetical protein
MLLISTSLAKDFTRTHKNFPAINPSKLPCSMTLHKKFSTTAGCEKRFLPLDAVMG